jgi:hypothetical protein
VGSLFQLGGHRRGHEVDQTLDLTPVQSHARQGQQLLTGRLVAFLSRRSRRQTHQSRREAVDQPQRLIEWEASGLRGGLVEIVSPHLDGAKERVDVLDPIGMTFFPGLAGVVRHLETGLVVYLFQHPPPVLEERLAQAQLDGLQIGDSLVGQALAEDV